ncbi:MAG: hypothetical protein ACOC8P_00530 [Dichotomicrobium sp.]
MKLRRWRARQRRAVWRALWLYAPFTAVEARRICRQIGYSNIKAARLIREHETDMRRIERDRARDSMATWYGRCDREILRRFYRVDDLDDLLRMRAMDVRACTTVAVRLEIERRKKEGEAEAAKLQPLIDTGG